MTVDPSPQPPPSRGGGVIDTTTTATTHDSHGDHPANPSLSKKA